MKRILSLLIVILLTNIPISCIKDDCGEFTRLEAKIIELDASVGIFSSSSGFSNSKSTDFTQVAIQITISDMEYSEISEVIRNTKFSFINAAYACSPPEPEPTQAIESIIITSKSSVFSQEKEFVASESLNELFKVTAHTYYNVESSISEYIETQNSDLYLFGYPGASIVIQLKNQPDSIINEIFTIDFEFSDSERIKIESDILEVSN